mgnify:CR=1 FL=1
MNAPGEGDVTSDKAIDRERHDHISMEPDKRERDIKEEKDLQMDREDKDSEQEGDKDLDGMQRLPNKRKSARRADELIRKQSLGGEGVDTTVGTSAPVASAEEKKVPKGISLRGKLQNTPDFFLYFLFPQMPLVNPILSKHMCYF